MQAVILAGGKGTRLQPFTAVFPKPLVPLGDKPILEIVIKQLSSFGVDRVVLSVGHLAHLIRAYFSEGTVGGCALSWFKEEAPLGTAGSLASLESLDDDFLVVNGDILTDLDFGALMASHRRSGADASLARFQKVHQVTLGVVETDAQGFLTSYVEKPQLEYSVSMGAYAINRSTVTRWLKRGERTDLPDLMKRVIAAGGRVNTFAHKGLWLDIGRPEDYAEAQLLVERRPELFGSPPKQ